jgi:hypothetical protein
MIDGHTCVGHQVFTGNSCWLSGGPDPWSVFDHLNAFAASLCSYPTLGQSLLRSCSQQQVMLMPTCSDDKPIKSNAK